MNQAAESAFGPDTPPDVDITKVAQQIRGLDVRALISQDDPVGSLDDVLTLIEFMKLDATSTHDAQLKRASELDTKERDLARRERELTLRARAVSLMPKRRRWVPWR